MDIITKQELNTLIAAVAEKMTCYAPVQSEDNVVEYVETNGDKKITYNYVNVTLSPKGLFFPQREVLCSFCGDDVQDVPVPDEQFVVFGARPCDARALHELEMVFGDRTGSFQDPYFLSRRQNGLLITLACNEPAATCFCTTVGGNPADATGSDILAFELGEELLFEAVSDKGSTFMHTYQPFFQKPDEAHLSQKEKNKKQAVETLESQNTSLLVPEKTKLDSIFEEEVWERITNNCVGCGACTYLCPTCHCFDMSDETDGQGCGIRLRTWDSCQYPLFTLHGSGHNPRVTKKQRMRQRIMHKFSYTVEKNDAIFCVGCGRCVTNCPVNLDIREMLTILNSV